MVNKLDAFAIRVFNWIIIATLATVLFIILNLLYPITRQKISFDSLKENIKIFGGLKK
jgi:hypothetical protein